MMTGTVLNVHIDSNEALLQRVIEDLATHVEFENGDADVIGAALQIVEQIKTRLAALRQEVEEIQLNPKWSDAHKVELVTEAVARAYKDLSTVRKDAATRQAAAEAAKQQLTAVPDAKTNETTDYLIGCEIRQRMGRMSPSERMTLFAHAVRPRTERYNGRSHTIRSMKS